MTWENPVLTYRRYNGGDLTPEQVDENFKYINDILQDTGTIGSSNYIASVNKVAIPGAVARAISDGLGDYVNARDFGVKADGVTDDTTALLAFYTHCVNTGTSGKIQGGTYLLSTGVLVFDCNFTDKAWPHIFTDGYQSTIFKINSATETDEPLLTWKNGTATSAAGKYWLGGSHGGVTVQGSGTATAHSNQHHFSFTGMWGTSFGWMRSQNCKGSSFYCPSAKYGGTNPDPYASTYLTFDGLESTNAAGYGFCNANSVGMNFWTVGAFRCSGAALGGWFGIGAGNTVRNLSVSCAGWAFDDGTNSSSDVCTRNTIEVAEFDNCQYGIRVNRSGRSAFRLVRFVARYQTAPNTSGTFWPQIGVDLAGGTSPSCYELDFDVAWRIESGGTLAVFQATTPINGNNSGNVTSTNVKVDYADNGGYGITDTMFSGSAMSSLATGQILRRSKILWYQPDRADSVAIGVAPQSLTSGVTNGTTTITYAANANVAVGMLVSGTNIASGSLVTQVISSTSCVLSLSATGSGTGITFTASVCVPGSGMFTAASKVAFPSQRNSGYQIQNYYSTTASTFTAPRSGLYLVNASIPLTLSASALCRICLAQNIGGTAVFWGTKYTYAQTTNLQHYTLSATVRLTAGDTLNVLAANSSGSPVAIGVATNYYEHCFSVTEIL